MDRELPAERMARLFVGALGYLAACILIVVVLMATAPESRAAPRSDQAECATWADIAMVSRVLSAEGVDKSVIHRAVRTIYTLPNSRTTTIAALVVEAASRSRQKPLEFALALAQLCVTADGDMGPMLGTSL